MPARVMEEVLWYAKLTEFQNWPELSLGGLAVAKEIFQELMSKCPTMKNGYRNSF